MRVQTLRLLALAALGAALGCRDATAPRPSAGLLPPLTGDVIVSVSTTGASLPGGYTATLDLLQSRSVPANGSTTFSGVLAGAHTVQLSDVAQNCTVASANPQVVTLVGSSVTASFTVSCSATTGTLKVTNTTSGSVPTTNYSVTVSGKSQAMPPNGSTTFNNLPAGSYTVTLSGVPANCTVTNGTSLNATVQTGQTTTTSFSVSCMAPTGTLKVTNSTSGSVPTTNYTVTVSGTNQAMPPNGSTTFNNLPAGSSTVTLS
ncbi:MAG TPA: hypothetical protein VM716_11140, partial [Gemmatimonadales bacterium]|nr:hypothetical protein [Gemmatimonadales bacterium]